MMFTVVLVCAIAVSAQVPIPTGGYNGFFKGSREAPIQLELFGDLLCPDTAKAWPAMKEVVAHYGSNIGFTFSVFPLPYHHQAFMTAQGAFTVQRASADKVWDYADLLFANQQKFWNPVADNRSAVESVAQLAAMVQSTVGIDQATFIAGLSDSDMDFAARTAWKVGCSRGISGTPSFLVNGVTVAGQATWTLKEWQWVLDPLLPSTDKVSATVLKALDTRMVLEDCPSGEELCEYLPGATQCCTPGERCIPNVGCRC